MKEAIRESSEGEAQAAKGELTSTKPLEILSGVRIAAFTQFLMGPAAVQYLADLGADVTKVEVPAGAWERNFSGAETYPNGWSLFYLMTHRNQRAITLNLKTPSGLEAAERLVAKADVLIENFRPGVMDRLGLGYVRAREINPRIVYASASGYGSDNPHRYLPGQDLLVQAMTGLMASTGTSADPPVPTGAPVVDQHGATLLALGVMAALYHRDRTGEAQRVEVTMVQAALDLQLEPVVYWLNGGKLRRPDEALGSTFHPAPYGVYRTKDGYMVISIVPMKAVAEALGNPPTLQPFLDPSVAFEQRNDIYRALAPLLAAKSTAEYISILRDAGVWCAPVLDYESAFDEPVIQHVDAILEIDHPLAGKLRVLKNPIRFSAGEASVNRMPPALGQQTDEILSELGYSQEQIDELRASGVL